MDMFSSEGRLAPVIEKMGGWRAGANPLINTPDEAGRIAGFWLGVWHGFIAPVSFVRSLFNDDVHVFEVHNSGTGYVAGFLLGVLLWAGGGRGGARRRG
jgi:hypothetical protein